MLSCLVRSLSGYVKACSSGSMTLRMSDFLLCWIPRPEAAFLETPFQEMGSKSFRGSSSKSLQYLILIWDPELQPGTVCDLWVLRPSSSAKSWKQAFT